MQVACEDGRNALSTMRIRVYRLDSADGLDESLLPIFNEQRLTLAELDLSALDFATPLGIGALYLAAAWLKKRFARVVLHRPTARHVDAYLLRCGIYQALVDEGVSIDGQVEPYNLGGAQNLIEFMAIDPDAGRLDPNHFRARLGDVAGRLSDQRVGRVWIELCGNAAEHSGAAETHGAYYFAQWYGINDDEQLQIVVVDKGVGIPRHLDFLQLDDEEVIRRACTDEAITGRRDAAGRLTCVGGYGLPEAFRLSNEFYVRSGHALLAANPSSTPLKGSSVLDFPGTLVGAVLRPRRQGRPD